MCVCVLCKAYFYGKSPQSTHSPAHTHMHARAHHTLAFMDKSSAGARQAKANTLSRTPHTTIIIRVRTKLSAALLSSLKLIREEDPGWVITTTFSCGEREEGREEGGRPSTYSRVVKERKGGRKEGDPVLTPEW